MTNTPEPKYFIHQGNTDEAEYIRKQIMEYNQGFVTDYEQYSFSLKDDSNQILGGIVAKRVSQRMSVEFLWVHDSLRGGGWGKILLEKIEEIAKEKKCKVIWLHTFDFQAPEFYLKMGYERFGFLEKCINGHSQHFLKKEL